MSRDISLSWRLAMPNAKPQPPSPALLELTWTTVKNGRTTALAVRLGFPFVAGLALLLGGTHLESGKKVLKALAVAFGFGP
jgi:hypothetical protein